MFPKKGGIAAGCGSLLEGRSTNFLSLGVLGDLVAYVLLVGLAAGAMGLVGWEGGPC